MLVLTRCENESVKLFLDGKLLCEVVLFEINRRKTKIGFQASTEVKIYRSELLREGDFDNTDQPPAA